MVKRRKRGYTIHRISNLLTRLLAVVAVVGAGVFLIPKVFPALLTLTKNAAVYSAYTNMPQGAISLLEQRFQGQTVPPDEWGANSSSSAPPPSSSSESSSESSESSSDSSSEPEGPIEMPDIPKEYQGTMLEEDLSGHNQGGLIQKGNALIKNYTSLSTDKINEILKKDSPVAFEDTAEPQVLIYHTHATESYEPFDREIYDTRNTWRDTDHNNNMIAVGNAMEEELKAAGIGVIHDKTLNDYPSYNGAYDRSAEIIKEYLEKYPTIKVILDVHRDAIEREKGLIVKPVTEIEGKKAAQLMIIAPCDDGTMDIPNWKENFRFAVAIQDQVEADYPTLMRPVFFSYRRYNMHLGNGSLLLEFGSHGNTLEECKYTASLVGKSLVKLLGGIENEKVVK